MSVELKVFPGAYFPKDKALKEFPDLKPLARATKAPNKGVAEAILTGEFAKFLPEHMNNYFKVKIWEHREELPCPDFDTFSPDFFETTAVWNAKTGEPAPFTAEPENTAGDQGGDAPELKPVRLLDQHSRAACLALFGPVEEITAAQYGQIVDLINDDQSSFEQNLAEALTKETRALALTAERQEQLLAWVREKASETAQWPDIKKLLAKWIDTPIEKRDRATSTTSSQQRAETGATLGGGNVTDRGFEHGELILCTEIAMGLLARESEFDIYDIAPSLHQKIAEIRLSATNEEFNAWHRIFTTTPGVLDFSRAINIAVVKTAPENIWQDQVKHREYFNRVMIESDHANPDPLIVDIACGRSSLPLPHQDANNEKTRPLPPGEADAPANKPLSDKEFNADIDRAIREQAGASQQPTIENLGGGVFSVDALMGQQPSNEVEKQEVPPALSEREFEIVTELNELLSARTNVIGQDDIDELVSNSGHSISQLIPLLLVDIATTEFCLSPDLSADEIHSAATTILESWSDSADVRQKVALDDVVEYRKPAPPKSSAPVTTIRTSNDAATEQLSAPAPTTLTYQQQLTIAALQGLCANPAYCTTSDEIPDTARLMALAIIGRADV